MSDMRQFVATPTVEECEARIEELEAENERLQDDLEHLGRVIANINDHHTRLQEKHRDAVLFLRSTLFNDGEAGSRLMEILSPETRSSVVAESQ